MDTFGAVSGPSPSDGAGSVFNAPPGWPVPPAGWRPPPGWQPDPSWPQAPAGWNFWIAPPAPEGVPGGEVRLSFGGKDVTVRPGETARIGRSPDNDVVTDVPFVSRQHAVLRWGAAGWELENVGSSSTLLNGEQVARVTVDRPLDLALGSADGPVLHVEPVAVAAAGPVREDWAANQAVAEGWDPGRRLSQFAALWSSARPPTVEALLAGGMGCSLSGALRHRFDPR